LGLFYFCWFLSSRCVHSQYEGARKKKSKQTPSDKNTHKKKKKMRMRRASEKRGLFASHTKTAKQYKAPQKNTHQNTQKKKKKKKKKKKEY
jgi:hypothetical protein